MRKWAAVSVVTFVAGVCVGGSPVKLPEVEARAAAYEQRPVTGSGGAVTRQATTIEAACSRVRRGRRAL